MSHRITDIIIEPKITPAIAVTWNPVTNILPNQNNAAFIIIPNSPRVKILIGNVTSLMTGLIRRLMNANTADAIRATVKLSTVISGIINGNPYTTSPNNIHFINNVIIITNDNLQGVRA